MNLFTLISPRSLSEVTPTVPQPNLQQLAVVLLKRGIAQGYFFQDV